jgi:hypothetical protein
MKPPRFDPSRHQIEDGFRAVRPLRYSDYPNTLAPKRATIFILTIQFGERSYRRVTAQTAVMRFGSREDSADQARLEDDSGAFSYGRARRRLMPTGSVGSSGLPTGVARPPEWKLLVGSIERTLPMSNHASGANVAHLFDPNQNTHYAISEAAKLELDTLFGALAAVHQVMDTYPGQQAPEIEAHHIAPLFASFAAHGRRIMADLPCQFPSRRKSS